MNSYLDAVADEYTRAAERPDAELCCTSAPMWSLPDLNIPSAMLEMNYGCGSTVDPRDLRSDATVLYIGVGGGLEALQLAYFLRRPGAVIAVDPVPAMRERAEANFEEAARLNPWFRPEFISVRDGSALDVPVVDGSIGLAAQNCLFNVFEQKDLERALSETFRVLRMGGKFVTSDPITPHPLPHEFVADDRLRARCLSGCPTYESYLASLTAAGFGRLDVRARGPYRLLHPCEYPSIEEPILLESVTVAAYKLPDGPDGPTIHSGLHGIFTGPEIALSDELTGMAFRRGIPQPVCDAMAERLRKNSRFIIVPGALPAGGGGCC